MDILELWRSDTRRAHERLEIAVGPIGDPAAYERYLRAMFTFLSPLEPAIAAHPEAPDVEVDARCRAPLAAEDLAFLGVRVEDLELCADLPDVSSWSRALGCLYVLEGSTLGARSLSREVERALGLGPSSGASFVHGHGERTAAMWASFRAYASAHAARTGAHAALREGAADTFAALERWVARVR